MTTGAPTPPSPARPRRSRLRTVLPLGIAAWVVLEIWLLTVVASSAGGFTVFLILLSGIVAGAAVIKLAGRRAFQALNEAMQKGTAPTGGGGNGLKMLGGLLLMIPGLISDAVGLLLLIPVVQKAVSGYAERAFERRLRQTAPGTLGDAFQQARMHRPDGKVVQGEVIRDEPADARPDPRQPRPPLNR